MESYPLITFLTDYGPSGGYVASCEAVIASLAPAARVLHISHDLAAGDIRGGATVLARVAPFAPPAIHLAIVDPGVGTARRALALHTQRGDFLVGPDNGLLLPAAAALGGPATTWVIEPARVRSQTSLPAGDFSSTFHGRDVFAPAAALLATGTLPALLAETCPFDSLVGLLPALVEHMPGGIVRAEVVEVDRFGNVALAVSFDTLRPMLNGCGACECRLQIRVEEEEEQLPWVARVVRTFGELPSGSLGLYRDSWGQTALTLNGASAAELLGAAPGTHVLLGVPENVPGGAVRESEPPPPDQL
jgi:S-adenosyl-L-methionine hydrolase (adenosine-forming)